MRVKMTVAVAAFAALVLGLPTSSYAHRTVTVKSGESIQAAIDKAKPGTTIKVEAGTYQESLLIKTDGIQLVGAGRKSTHIVPPANPTAGQGCVSEDQRDPPPAPPVTVANGICVANVDEQFNIIEEVKGVHISRLSVTGFNGFGMLFFGSRNGVVERTIASDNGEYGIFANTSSGTVIARNVTGNDGEAGIYVGDSPHADATVWKNVSYGNNNGIFIRDAAHGRVLKNKTFGNSAGILFLNTDESAEPPPPGAPPAPSIDVQDWLAKQNDASANNKPGAVGGDEPPLSGIGIAVASGIDVRLIDNGVFGNKAAGPGSPFSGGILVVGDPSFKPSVGTKVAFNTAFGNEPDLLWDGAGAGNAFFGNDCLTSQPDGLCEDPDTSGDNGDHGDDGGHKGGDRDHADHKKNDKKKHKKHRKHKKHKKHKKHQKHDD